MTDLRDGSAEEAGLRPERLDLLRRRAAGWVESGRLPSLVLCVARRGVVCFHEAWGDQRPDGPPLRVDHVFPVSSIAKPITATLAMILVEDGLLGLARPVRHYLPELCGEGTERLLVSHLMSHTSGFESDEVSRVQSRALRAGLEPPTCGPGEDPLAAMLLAAGWSAPARCAPGELLQYADHNYLLLGEIVRRVAGRSLEAFARERLFDPLGMSSTWYRVPENESARVIERSAEAAQPVPRLNAFFEGLDSRQMQRSEYGNAGVFSIARDLVSLGEMFKNGGILGERRVLSPASVGRMTRNQIPGVAGEFRGLRYPEASWGLGWMVQSPALWRYWLGELWSGESFFHGGFGGCYLWVDPRHEIVAAAMSVVMEATEDWELKGQMDLAANLVHAALTDRRDGGAAAPGLRDGAANEAGLDASRIALARSRCKEWVESGHTPSLVVLAARNGIVALHEAFGQRTPGGEPLDRDAIFPLQSVSKPLTAASVLALVEDGLLGLQRPLVDYLPDLECDHADQILVGHLLSHTSGFDDPLVTECARAKGSGFDPGPVAEGRTAAVHDYLERRWDAQPVGRPGERMVYSNHNYELLAEIVRVASGSDLDVWSQKRLFEPLGMSSTGYLQVDRVVRERMVVRPPEAAAAGKVQEFPGIESRWFHESPWGGAGAHSSARDLAVFLQMLLDGGRYGSTRVLSPATVEAMTSNRIPGVSCEFQGIRHVEASYGWGFIVESTEPWSWGHGAIAPPASFYHQGLGGVLLWADPSTRTLGVWLGVTMELGADWEQYWDADRFQSMVVAAAV